MRRSPCGGAEASEMWPAPFSEDRFPEAITAMARILLICMVLAVPCEGQTNGCPSPQSSNLDRIPTFGGKPGTGVPEGWTGGPAGTIYTNAQVVHNGQWSVRIQRNSSSPSKFSSLTNCVQMDFDGRTVEMRGFLRTENASEFAGLWMREDGDAGPVAFDNMQGRHLQGTTGWQEYSITLPDKPEGKQLYFGVLLAGTGQVWVSNLQLLVDGKPIWQAPKAKRLITILDRDHQFDKGSGIVIRRLTKTQVKNLVTLGKVWGFLKYYDPQVTVGQWQWDFELFRILPSILGA